MSFTPTGANKVFMVDFLFSTFLCPQVQQEIKYYIKKASWLTAKTSMRCMCDLDLKTVKRRCVYLVFCDVSLLVFNLSSN